MKTEYRRVKGFLGYVVSTNGNVYSRKTGKWKRLAGSTHRDGHRRVILLKNGERFGFQAHRLILETFVGPCPDGMECRHLNGDPADNRLENLSWGTRAENAADKVRHGRSGKGSKRSPETRAKISFKAKGRKPSSASIAATIAANTGRKRSPESIAKTAAANRERARLRKQNTETYYET